MYSLMMVITGSGYEKSNGTCFGHQAAGLKFILLWRKGLNQVLRSFFSDISQVRPWTVDNAVCHKIIITPWEAEIFNELQYFKKYRWNCATNQCSPIRDSMSFLVLRWPGDSCWHELRKKCHNLRQSDLKETTFLRDHICEITKKDQVKIIDFWFSIGNW